MGTLIFYLRFTTRFSWWSMLLDFILILLITYLFYIEYSMFWVEKHFVPWANTINCLLATHSFRNLFIPDHSAWTSCVLREAKGFSDFAPIEQCYAVVGSLLLLLQLILQLWQTATLRILTLRQTSANQQSPNSAVLQFAALQNVQRR